MDGRTDGRTYGILPPVQQGIGPSRAAAQKSEEVSGCQVIKNEQKRGRFSHFIFDMSDKKLNIFLTAGPNLMGLPPLSLFFQGL